MRQITLNLLSNAVKFTPSGGEIVVRVGWTAGGGQYVSVKDDGPGIPEEEIPIVLSAFGQGSIAIKSAEQGTGLGLPIVQGLIAMHGGEFQLHSKLRDGHRGDRHLPGCPRHGTGARNADQRLAASPPARMTGRRLGGRPFSHCVARTSDGSMSRRGPRVRRCEVRKSGIA